ncbi:MAG: hypothetical protein K2O35_05660 [Clostridia bacterium]|nr:hypothetical protein [Clostridia bacterium]
MKSLTTKRIGVLAMVVAVAFLMIVGSCLIFGDSALADTDTDYAYKYFYNQISVDPIAERFYKAFETLANNGEFKKGKLQYDLIANNVATLDEVKAYVNGADDNRLAKSYGIGRDAFYMDHPDLFYIDVFSTSITAGMKNGEYVAYLDSSRVLSLYRGESINSEALVNEAIQKYENAISQIVDSAKNLSSDKEKIEYVNDYICKHNKYGFGTVLEGNRNVDTPKADFIFTSYGALVNNESVCEGYAKSFKAVMDRLGIPCVCVSGYSVASDGESPQPHMWNYVQVDGMWYGVDVTYNSASSQNPWILRGGQAMLEEHIEDGSVSSSGYELRYPALKPYDYGVDYDANGMTVIGKYNNTDVQGTTLDLTISYEGMGALALQEQGMYLAYSFGYSNAGEEITWSNWVNIIAANNAAKEMMGVEIYSITDSETVMAGIGTGVKYIQFALIKRAPDTKGDWQTGDHIVSYDAEKLTDEDFWFAPTAPYLNEGFGSYTPSPGARSITPSNTGDLPVNNTYDIKIEYSETLELNAGFTLDDIGIDFYTLRGNDTVKDHAVIENFYWDGDKTISFTLTPSKMYIHNATPYYFTPVGLVGSYSKKVPDPVRFAFKGKTVVCSKIFNDGRLYMSLYGQPNLLDNSDVSVTDFQDEDGNYYAASQRSQLILVATKPSAQKEQEMDDVLKSETAVKDDDILASASYEINLNLCGCVKTVPNGSYMQVAFGFPEGYDPDDANTTFKIYHYKHDKAGKIIGVEEIPVIINEYGIIAKVTSFSPFTIVQIKNTSAAVTESNTSNIYAYVNGEVGGKITSDGKSGIIQVSDKITYDITPDKGYAIGCVVLNGKVVDTKEYQNGKLTLAKKDLQSSNMLEVRFMSQEIASDYAKNGMSIAFNGEVIDSFGVVIPEAGPKSNVAGIIIGCVVAVVVIAAIALAVFFVLKKKKGHGVVRANANPQPNLSTPTGMSAARQSKESIAKSVAPPASKSKATASKSTTAKTSSAKTSSASKSATAKSTSATKKTSSTASKSTSTKTTSKSTTVKKK